MAQANQWDSEWMKSISGGDVSVIGGCSRRLQAVFRA